MVTDGRMSGASGKTQQLRTEDIVSVATWSDIGVSSAFEVVSSKKDGKVYKFSANSDEERDGWMAAIASTIGDNTLISETVITDSNPLVPPATVGDSDSGGAGSATAGGGGGGGSSLTADREQWGSRWSFLLGIT